MFPVFLGVRSLKPLGGQWISGEEALVEKLFEGFLIKWFELKRNYLPRFQIPIVGWAWPAVQLVQFWRSLGCIR